MIPKKIKEKTTIKGSDERKEGVEKGARGAKAKQMRTKWENKQNKVTNINNCCFIQQFASNSALNYMQHVDVYVDVNVAAKVSASVYAAFMQMPFGFGFGFGFGFWRGLTFGCFGF